MAVVKQYLTKTKRVPQKQTAVCGERNSHMQSSILPPSPIMRNNKSPIMHKPHDATNLGKSAINPNYHFWVHSKNK